MIKESKTLTSTKNKDNKQSYIASEKIKIIVTQLNEIA